MAAKKKKKLNWDEGPQPSDRARKQREAALALLIKERRKLPSAELIKELHRVMFDGIAPDDEIGEFRDQDQVPESLRGVNVRVGKILGASYETVFDEVDDFITEFRTGVKRFDVMWSQLGKTKTYYAIDQMIKLAAWAHGEWIRIHPFINGNGRTARLWINYVIVRYGFPALPIRPRPNSPYSQAAAQSMEHGDHNEMESVLYQLLAEAFQSTIRRLLGVFP